MQTCEPCTQVWSDRFRCGESTGNYGTDRGSTSPPGTDLVHGLALLRGPTPDRPASGVTELQITHGAHPAACHHVLCALAIEPAPTALRHRGRLHMSCYRNCHRCGTGERIRGWGYSGLAPSRTAQARSCPSGQPVTLVPLCHGGRQQNQDTQGLHLLSQCMPDDAMNAPSGPSPSTTTTY